MTPGTFVNPKVGASCDPVDSWYRYYAGYSAGFVEQALTGVGRNGEASAGSLERDRNDDGRRREQEGPRDRI